MKYILIIFWFAISCTKMRSKETSIVYREEIQLLVTCFERELNAQHEHSQVYTSFADSCIKYNGTLRLTEGIINMFDEFTRSKVYDDIWYTDSMYGRIELREESMFMEIVDQMAEENEIMSYGRGLLKETGYFPPSFIVDYFANIREFNMERPEQKIFYILLIADSYYRYN